MQSYRPSKYGVSTSISSVAISFRRGLSGFSDFLEHHEPGPFPMLNP